MKTIQQRIWDFIYFKKITSKKEIQVSLNIKEASLNSYITALSKSFYIMYCTNHGRNFAGDIFKLVKYTGSRAPLFNQGILRDFNTKEEYKISNSLQQDLRRYKLLLCFLDSILSINKEFISNADITKKMKETYNNKNLLGGYTKRWRDKLEVKGYIKQVGTYRNSPIFSVNKEDLSFLFCKVKENKDYSMFL